MHNGKNLLSERLLEYAASRIDFTVKLNKNHGEKYIAGQWLRSSACAGANYEETCGAESKADFIHKLQLVLKELRESFYWIKLLQRTYCKNDKHLPQLKNEVEELVKIVSKSVITAKKNR